MNDTDIKKILEEFGFKGNIIEYKRYGNGHINQTFYLEIENIGGIKTKYILQRVNTDIFQKPIELMENIYKVTNYLKEVIIANGGDYRRETLNYVQGNNGKNYFIDNEGWLWRIYYYVDNVYCLENVEDSRQMYECGKAFGNFMRLLAKFPVNELHETISLFHDTKNRFDKFLKAVDEDKFNRVQNARSEIDFLLKKEDDSGYLVRMIKEGKLPLRVTHNDTKLSNILFDKETNNPICIIDLDTIMPGIAAYDFGDSIRTGACKGREDEENLDNVNFDIGLYKEYTKGFLEKAGDILSEEEVKSLPWGARVMTLETAIRFLTDYLVGDVYYNIKYPEHNLVRSRTQIKLLKQMEEQFDEMKKM